MLILTELQFQYPINKLNKMRKLGTCSRVLKSKAWYTLRFLRIAMSFFQSFGCLNFSHANSMLITLNK